MFWFFAKVIGKLPLKKLTRHKMHYYSFHVSDYIHDTAHLNNDEDLAFRRLLDLYYTQEKPIPNKFQEVARRIRMGKSIVAIQTVLEEFFMYSQEHDFWFHKRCDETIAAYQAKAERNREVGKLGGRPKANPKETQTVSKHNPNQEPITNNHKPNKEIQAPFGVSDDVWESFVKQRKLSRATVTDTVIKSIDKEAQKAGWTLEQALSEIVARGWRGFKAEWVKDKTLTPAATKKQEFISGLTRGLMGGDKNVKLIDL